MVTQGRQELDSIRRQFRGIYLWVGIFSLFMNLLMLTGPIYMMQVYDRVLSSKSEATLVALSLIVVFLYAMMGVLDVVRARLLTRVAGQFQKGLDARVFAATMSFASLYPKKQPHPGLRDIESIQRLMASPAVHAVFDLPWTPVFLFALWVFHPALFGLAMLGGIVLIVISFTNQRIGQQTSVKASTSAATAYQISDAVRQNADTIQAMGMAGNVLKRWQKQRDLSIVENVHALDIGGSFSSLSRTIRLILQSAMLGVGAWLVLQGDLSAGAMIAASVLLGRALAPIEALISQWATIQRGLSGWKSLVELLENVPAVDAEGISFAPKPLLDVKEITVIPPGERQAVLRMVNFNLRPGHACGVIGPSGAGKSSLAKVLTGLWEPAAGAVRLDGSTLTQYAPDALGAAIGYLPQTVTLFEGTIAENIARLSDRPDMNAVKLAAERAGIRSLVDTLPNGFDTQINAQQAFLSGGQVQRIGLARALFGDPVIVILDEPNANLDNEGNLALNAAIADLKRRQRIVLVMAHRPTAIQECDVLLMIENGARKAFGPKEQVLRKVVQNHSTLHKPILANGVS